MATHDYNLANQSGASFRSDLNNALAAILSNNSNASAPSTTVAYSIWADTNAGKLKIRNAANDAFVDLINLDGTIARDLQLTGASANIVFDQSDNALEFADNALATFGDGADLTISHDGSNSIINDAGTGELQLQRGGSTVVALSSTGADLTGDLTASGKFIASSSSSGDYVRVYAGSGTGKWDMYGSGANLRFSDNDSAGYVQIDTRLGLGTSSPSQQMELSSTAPNIRLTDTVDGHSELDGNTASLKFNADKGNTRASTTITFFVDNSEKVRIDNNGHFLVNCTSLPSSSVAGAAFEKNGNTAVLFVSNGSATTNSNTAEFLNGNGVVGRITTNGSNCSFTDVSDYRLKENEVLISDGITRLKQLKPYRFNYKSDASETFDGFFAHEAQTVVPESVVGEKDATNKDGSIDPQCIDQSKLVPLLVAAVQELIGKVAALEAA
jgi:hypothetical protein